MAAILESPQNRSQQVLFLMQCPDDARAPVIRKRSSKRILPFLDVAFFEMKRHQSFELLQGLTSGYLG